MNNQDTAWIIVRAFGVYFLAHMLLSLFEIGSNAFSLFTIHEIANSASLLEKAEPQIILSKSRIIGHLINLVIFALLAYYCLRKGLFIHRLLIYKGVKSDET